jgi:hypothetical protein
VLSPVWSFGQEEFNSSGLISPQGDGFFRTSRYAKTTGMTRPGPDHDGFLPTVHFGFEFTQQGKPGVLSGAYLLQLEHLIRAHLNAGAFGFTFIKIHCRHYQASFLFTFSIRLHNLAGSFLVSGTTYVKHRLNVKPRYSNRSFFKD